MDPHAQAVARGRAYRLFGRLFAEGLTDALLPWVAEVEELAPAADLPADARAADHHELFARDVHPYASVFLDRNGQLGGPVADRARHLLASSGLDPAALAEPPDHLACQLALMAFLSRAEADALEDARPDEVARVRRVQARAVDAQLLWWLPSFAFAVRRRGHPFYTPLAELTLELVLAHRAGLEGETPTAEAPLPEMEDPLRDDAGLAQVAGFLVTPARSGIYLGASALEGLGRSADVPRGFGGRRQTLTNLLRSAGTYGRLDEAVGGLLAMVAGEGESHRRLASGGTPGALRVAAAWTERLDLTHSVLARMLEAGRSAPEG